MAVNLILPFSFDKQILYLLKIIFANHLQTEQAWNCYSHTHLAEGIFMWLLLVNKVLHS